jgi:phage FluMu protein Com
MSISTYRGDGSQKAWRLRQGEYFLECDQCGRVLGIAQPPIHALRIKCPRCQYTNYFTIKTDQGKASPERANVCGDSQCQTPIGSK